MQVSSLFFIVILLAIGSIGGLAMVGTMSAQDPSTTTDNWGATASPQTAQSAEMIKDVGTMEGTGFGAFAVFVAAAGVITLAIGAFMVMRKKGYGSNKYRTG
jgi:hypothetical protein